MHRRRPRADRLTAALRPPNPLRSGHSAAQLPVLKPEVQEHVRELAASGTNAVHAAMQLSAVTGYRITPAQYRVLRRTVEQRPAFDAVSDLESLLNNARMREQAVHNLFSYEYGALQEVLQEGGKLPSRGVYRLLKIIDTASSAARMVQHLVESLHPHTETEVTASEQWQPPPVSVDDETGAVTLTIAPSSTTSKEQEELPVWEPEI